MVDFEWDPDYVPNVKLGLHVAQLLFSFVAWCLEIAVFMGKDAKITGDNGWTFGVVRLLRIPGASPFPPELPRQALANLLALNTVLPFHPRVGLPCHDASILADSPLRRAPCHARR